MAESPVPSEFLYPDDQVGPWRVKIWWRVQHGVPTPVGLEIKTWNDDPRSSGPHNNLPGPSDEVVLERIDSQIFRSLPVGQLIERGRAQMEAMYSQDTADEAWKERTAKSREAFATSRRGRDLGDEHYQEVADVYASAVREGRPPTVAVSQHFQIEKSSAAKKVARARDRGFLPPTSRGRVGRLTEEI